MEKFSVANVVVDVPEDFDLLIMALARADGQNLLAIALEEGELRDLLISTGYAREDESGALYGTDKLREEKDDILAAFVEQTTPSNKLH